MKVIVFDVDCTLTKEHVSARIHEMLKKHDMDVVMRALRAHDELIADGVRVAVPMRDFVDYCRINDVRIALGSFGYAPYVEHVADVMESWWPSLQLLWLRDAKGARVLMTPSMFGHPDGTNALRNKNRMLLHVCELASVPFTHVMLVDDSVENVQAASRHGAGVYHVTNPHGLVGEDWRYICMRL